MASPSLEVAQRHLLMSFQPITPGHMEYRCERYRPALVSARALQLYADLEFLGAHGTNSYWLGIAVQPENVARIQQAARQTRFKEWWKSLWAQSTAKSCALPLLPRVCSSIIRVAKME